MTRNEGAAEIAKQMTPLRGRYLVRHRLLNAALRVIDGGLRTALGDRSRRSTPPPPAPRRILLANGAHLGDVLIFSSVIPALRRAFPDIEIGVAVGAWSRPIVSSNPDVRWVHVIDHWMLNRSGQPLLKKIVHYLRTRSRALKEIRGNRYDVAIDFYYYFPNMLPLLRQSGIPVRIGYGSGGFGPLLTHEASWQNKDCHVVDYHRELLRFLNPPEESPAVLRPPAPSFEPKAEQKLRILLTENGRDSSQYILIHVGTGHTQKEWPLANWRELVARLIADGHHLVFTGTGSHEERLISSIIEDMQGCSNLCGKLAWPEYVAAISHARLAVCVDSLAGHLAAAVDTPCVVIKSGISHPLHWRPLSDRCEVLTAPVECSPCYRSNGCSTMDCIRGVLVSQVYDACARLIAEKSRGIAHSN